MTGSAGPATRSSDMCRMCPSSCASAAITFVGSIIVTIFRGDATTVGCCGCGCSTLPLATSGIEGGGGGERSLAPIAEETALLAAASDASVCALRSFAACSASASPSAAAAAAPTACELTDSAAIAAAEVGAAALSAAAA